MKMMKNPSSPDWANLLDLWLTTHFQGKPAAIFYDPLGGESVAQRMRFLGEHFGTGAATLSVGAEFLVKETGTVEEASRIMRETPKGNPYTLVWNGEKIVGHH